MNKSWMKEDVVVLNEGIQELATIVLENPQWSSLLANLQQLVNDLGSNDATDLEKTAHLLGILLSQSSSEISTIEYYHHPIDREVIKTLYLE